MSTLSNSLKELLRFLEKAGLPPPTRQVRIIEIPRPAARDESGRLIVPWSALRKPSDYESRFEELTHSDLPWINLSCYGVYNGFLIVAVEMPHQIFEKISSKPTSVNYSGPPARVTQGGWDVSTEIQITQESTLT